MTNEAKPIAARRNCNRLLARWLAGRRFVLPAKYSKQGIWRDQGLLLRFAAYFLLLRRLDEQSPDQEPQAKTQRDI